MLPKDNLDNWLLLLQNNSAAVPQPFKLTAITRTEDHFNHLPVTSE